MSAEGMDGNPHVDQITAHEIAAVTGTLGVSLTVDTPEVIKDEGMIVPRIPMSDAVRTRLIEKNNNAGM